MSSLTAEGGKKIRDHRRAAVGLQLRKDPRLAHLPAHQRATLGELKIVGRDLYSDIRRRGVMLPDGTVNPAVEAHRKNAQTQLHSLQVFMKLNRTQNADPVVDLVQLMSGQGETGEAPEAAAEPAADAADEGK